VNSVKVTHIDHRVLYVAILVTRVTIVFRIDHGHRYYQHHGLSFCPVLILRIKIVRSYCQMSLACTVLRLNFMEKF
jgi:hypothetical protein